MNYQLSQAWSGLKQFQKKFDVLTGGGFRALAKRRLRFLRAKLRPNRGSAGWPSTQSQDSKPIIAA